jgi:hypothetical protein
MLHTRLKALVAAFALTLFVALALVSVTSAPVHAQMGYDDSCSTKFESGYQYGGVVMSRDMYQFGSVVYVYFSMWFPNGEWWYDSCYVYL